MCKLVVVALMTLYIQGNYQYVMDKPSYIN
jgi:hypothetical protein